MLHNAVQDYVSLGIDTSPVFWAPYQAFYFTKT